MGALPRRTASRQNALHAAHGSRLGHKPQQTFGETAAI
jgi:hypothetical protein